MGITGKGEFTSKRGSAKVGSIVTAVLRLIFLYTPYGWFRDVALIIVYRCVVHLEDHSCRMQVITSLAQFTSMFEGSFFGFSSFASMLQSILAKLAVLANS